MPCSAIGRPNLAAEEFAPPTDDRARNDTKEFRDKGVS
jgi:hypothetical protein